MMIMFLEKMMVYLPEIMLAGMALGLTVYYLFNTDPTDSNFNFLQVILPLILAGTLIFQWVHLPGPMVTFGLAHSKFTIFMKGCVLVLSLPFWGIKQGFFRKTFERATLHFPEYGILTLLSILGSFIIISSRNWVITYVGLELQVMPWYILLSYRQEQPKFIEGGIKYFIFGSVASAILVYGFAFIYGATGSFEFTPVPVTGWGMTGCVLLLTGLFLKMAIAPFHLWVSEVYEGADIIQIGYLATIPLITFISLLLQIIHGPFEAYHPLLEKVFYTVGCISILTGALGALHQHTMGKLLAFAGISQLGTLIVVFLSAPSLSLLYALTYVLVTMGLLMGLACLHRDNQNIKTLDDLNGLGKQFPSLAFTMLICILSLSSFPPLPGFWAKFTILLTLLEQQAYGILSIIIMGTLLSFYYYLQIVRHLYFVPLDQAKLDGDIKYQHSYQFCLIILFLYVFIKLESIQYFIKGLQGW